MSDDRSARRYQRAKAIVMEALECAPGQRQELIDARCGDDHRLREEVGWLIDAAEDDSADEVPERIQQATEHALRQVSLQVPLPRDYRLLRRLGHGGMGIVYLAERQDGEIRQRVALKLLHVADHPQEALANRFANEQRSLSRLNQPNIAHLIDAGVTAEGRPFMATEYVDGQAIDQWCRDRQPSLKDRIELFLKVCDAVDHAHRHMVIHRDIKPSNILVTADGEPKLLDFGIARLIDAEPDDGEGDRQGLRALTTAHASPEQIVGADLSVATDVYSLGTVLYQLICDRAPFAGIEDAEQLAEAVQSGRYPAPREIAGRKVAGDLEAIVLKAMRRDSHERYESVRALADDLERYLNHHPVRACGGYGLYRLRKFGWRHRWAVIASAAIVLALAVFLVDREAQLQRIAWERDRAEAVIEFMNEMFAGAGSLPARGNEVTVREILDLGAEQLSGSGERSPAELGSIYLAIGRAYNALGLGEQALPLLTAARSSLEPQIAPAQRAMIQAEVGAALDSGGRAVEAIAADERAIDMFEQAPGDFEHEVMRVRIRKLRNHANVLDVPLENTIGELRELITDLESAAEPSQELLFEARAALVGAHVIRDDAQVALELAERVRSMAESLYAPDDPRRLRGRYIHATALMVSDPEAAVAMYEDLIADHQRLVGPGQRLANTIGNFGVALSRIGRTRESMQAFSRAAEMIEETVGRDHYLHRLSTANLAALHLREGETGEVEALIGEILPELRERHERLGGIETMYCARALDILGSALMLENRLPEAAEAFTEALEILQADDAGAWPALADGVRRKLEEVRSELENR